MKVTVYTLEEHDKLIEEIRAGTMTAERLHQAATSMKEQLADVRQQLQRLTLKVLEKRAPAYYRMNKSQWVEHANHYMIDQLAAANPTGLSWTQGEDMNTARWARVLAVTDEMLTAYTAKLNEQRQAFMKALTNPETLAEFETFKTYVKRGEAALTDDQLALFDCLYSDRWLAQHQAEVERRALVEKIEEVQFTIRPDRHTKRNCDIWVVSIVERVDRDKYREVAEKAEQFGGHWSSWGSADKHGFIFFEEDDAAAFLGLTDGDGSLLERWQRREEEKRARAVDRLNSVAGARESEADESLAAERKINTVRQAAMAESAERNALEQKREASILRAVAEALAGGDLRYLKRLRFATQVETLEYCLERAKDKHIRATHDGHYPESEKDRPVCADDIRYAELPLPYLSESDYNALKSTLQGRRGTKRLFHLLPAPKDERVDLTNRWSAIAARDLYGMAGWKHALQRWDDIERLWILGIDETQVLRAALREYFRFRPEINTQIDQIKLMEWDLIGRQILGYWPTVPALADRVVEVAEIVPGMRTLEPSAGSGRIAEAVRRRYADAVSILCCEINPRLQQLLTAKGFSVLAGDFLSATFETAFQRILMNPPFEAGQDIDHVRRAFSLLAPGGRLVAIMSEGPFFRSDEKARCFRDWLAYVGGHGEKLPTGSFKDSGTDVAVRLVVIDRSADEIARVIS